MTREDAEALARAEAARRGFAWTGALDVQRVARYGRCGPPQWRFTHAGPRGRITICVDDRTGTLTVGD